MKLIDISALCLSRPHEPFRQWFSATFHVYKADCSILVINMDEGICGISDAFDLWCAVPHPPGNREEKVASNR